MFVQKLVKSVNFFKPTIDNIGMFLTFLYILTHISLGLLSPVSAKANTGWGGKLYGHLMANCVWNICTESIKIG